MLCMFPSLSRRRSLRSPPAASCCLLVRQNASLPPFYQPSCFPALPCGTYVSEVHDAQLSERTDNISSNLVGNVELRQGHIRRAEQRVLWRRHGGGVTCYACRCGCKSARIDTESIKALGMGSGRGGFAEASVKLLADSHDTT